MPRGRPPFVATDKDRTTVRAMTGFGIPEAEIAKALSIDPKTLRKHFGQELEVGHVEANAKVAASLFRRATGEGREAVVAAIFWLKCRAGWREQDKRDAEERVSALVNGKGQPRVLDAEALEDERAWEEILGNRQPALPAPKRRG